METIKVKNVKSKVQKFGRNHKKPIVVSTPILSSVKESIQQAGTVSQIETTKNPNKDETQSNIRKVITSQQQSSVSLKFSDPKRINSEKSIISLVRFRELQLRAERAIRENKTFMSRFSGPLIRTEFLRRNWVELFTEHLKQRPSGISRITYEKIMENLPKQKKGESQCDYVQSCEQYILSRLIEHKPVAIIWALWRNKIDSAYKRTNPRSWINKIGAIPFGTKGGLLRQLQSFTWVAERGIAEVNFPRSYNSAVTEDMTDFTENYRNTACISFLKYAVERSKQLGWPVVFGSNATAEIPFSAFEFALKRCYELLNWYSHNDIDLQLPNLRSDLEWQEFFHHLNLLTGKNIQIWMDSNRSIKLVLKNADMLLTTLKKYWPQYDLDGFFNLWILKPSYENCGRGLEITNSLEKINSLVSLSKKRYVLQKYIERPLLIHNTKFDVRQWFLVTSVEPLVIWMYKENYLRFSTQVFSLTNLHESVHLTNNCIQRKYAVNVLRDQRLPQKNMWDCHTFSAYLRRIGKGDVYMQCIYPGMKKAIIATLLSSQKCMSQLPNSFELFGADFMISEDLTPWLIEINSCPDLSRTNNVTARLVPRLIEDVLNVVFDRRQEYDCNVGNFELIFNQSLPLITTATSTKSSVNLRLKGVEISSIHTLRREMYDHLVRSSSSNLSRTSQSTALASVSKTSRHLNSTHSNKLSHHFEDTAKSSTTQLVCYA